MASNNSINLPTSALNTVVMGQGVGSDFSTSTATYPPTTTINEILYSSAANTVVGLTTAINGLLVTSNTGVPSVLAGPGTTGQVLQANAAAAPSFSTASYPSTTTINRVLFSSANNVVDQIATNNNGLLVTSAAGVPSILAGPGTTGQILQANAAAAPSFSTASYPSTTTINRILYSSANNVVSEITTANDGVLITSAAGVPSISSTLPAAVLANIPGRLVSITRLSSGTGATYNLPAGITSIFVECTGGGGGGGSCNVTATTFGVGGGGGSGAFVTKYYSAPAASYTYTIGPGGAGGAAGGANAGATGTATTFDVITAAAGAGGASNAGGTAGAVAAGGTGGAAGGSGDGNWPGAAGGTGMGLATGGGGNVTVGGFGGTSASGGGPVGGIGAPGATAGNNATTNSGAGGSGAAGAGAIASAAGGAGGSGYIRIFEYA